MNKQITHNTNTFLKPVVKSYENSDATTNIPQKEIIKAMIKKHKITDLYQSEFNL